MDSIGCQEGDPVEVLARLRAIEILNAELLAALVVTTRALACYQGDVWETVNKALAVIAKARGGE